MAITCAHCSRVNPAEAVYCYFDGSALNSHTGGGPVNVGSMRFPAPFIFPSGRSCATFDQLALTCQEEWATARDLLRDGTLERFLGNLGRVDLALAAHTAADFPDADRALDQFLERLPTQALPPPKLAVEPAEVNLGNLHGPDEQQFELRLANTGRRLLYGAVVSDCKWLTLGAAPGNAQKLFQATRTGTVTVNVRLRHLRAGPAQEGRLIVESNGGRVEVKVRAALAANPFPEGPLAGATTPRELAEKARAAPKEAVVFFENGSVERWYQSNGWPYPVKGARASGLAAVQQFFEALGLAKPPKVELSEEVLSLRGRPGEALRQTLQVKAAEKRPIYASASSDEGWLVVGPVQVAGSVATIPLEVNPVPGEPGTVLQARVRVTANGGQTFVVPVSLAVGQAATSGIKAAAVVTVAPVDTDLAKTTRRKTKPALAGKATLRKKARATRAEDDDEDEQEGSGKKFLLVGSLLLLLLLLLGGGLWLALGGWDNSGKVEVAVHDEPPEEKKIPKGPPVFKVQEEDEPVEVIHAVLPIKHQIQDEPEERTKPQMELPVQVTIREEPEEVQPGKGKDGGSAPIDPEPRVFYQYDKQMRFGITALKDQFGRPLNKRLTYSPDGLTNNTRIRVNGADAEFGEPAGRWLVRAQPLPDDPAGLARQRTQSILRIGNGLEVTQTLEVVPSKQPVQVAGGMKRRLLDTVFVRYTIENKDKRPHNVGLRVQVDTLIGSNDGVPFTVPGYAGLCNTMADFRAPRKIPDFVQALEMPNLQNPGTVALMTLRPGGGLEPPTRVSLTHWFGGAPWEVPMQNIAEDSAVIIYWFDKLLKPGQKRQFGFAYGLGAVDASEGAGRLGLSLSGSFEPGQVFTASAYVSNPVPNQTVTLEVPAGLQIEGKPTVAVPKGVGNPPTSVVTWNVKVQQTGEFRVRVRSSTGAAQSKTISISRPDAPSGGKLALDLQGPFEPGQAFTVIGKVTAPVPNQTLTLKLPRGLDLAEGAGTQLVPAPPGGDKDGTSTVMWKVRVSEPGKYPVRVESSSGVAQTKTLTIVRPDQNAGRFRLSLAGEFAPGKAFVLRADVFDPAEGQTLRLHLPRGLERTEGEESQKVAPPAQKGGSTSVTWKVKVGQPGKFPLRVESSTGLTQKKTLTIEQHEDSGGQFVLKLVGEIAPGKEFTVHAQVQKPPPGQTLTLSLPKELQLVRGQAMQAVMPTAGGQEAQVQWRVRVLEKGRLRVRVESSTGVARSKTITLTEVPQGGQAIFGQ